MWIEYFRKGEQQMNYYQLALEEFLTKPEQRVNGRRVTDVTEHERLVILARASELARRSTLASKHS